MILTESVASTLQQDRPWGRHAIEDSDVGRCSYQMDERARFMPLPREIWKRQVFREWSQDEVLQLTGKESARSREFFRPIWPSGSWMSNPPESDTWKKRDARRGEGEREGEAGEEARLDADLAPPSTA